MFVLCGGCWELRKTDLSVWQMLRPTKSVSWDLRPSKSGNVFRRYGRCWDLRPNSETESTFWVGCITVFWGAILLLEMEAKRTNCCCRRCRCRAGRQAGRFLPGPPSIVPSLAAVRRAGEGRGRAKASGGAARGAADPAQPGDVYVVMTAFFYRKG